MLQITGPLPTEKKKNTPTKLCSVTNPYTTSPVPSTTALSVSASIRQDPYLTGLSI